MVDFVGESTYVSNIYAAGADIPLFHFWTITLAIVSKLWRFHSLRGGNLGSLYIYIIHYSFFVCFQALGVSGRGQIRGRAFYVTQNSGVIQRLTAFWGCERSCNNYAAGHRAARLGESAMSITNIQTITKPRKPMAARHGEGNKKPAHLSTGGLWSKCYGLSVMVSKFDNLIREDCAVFRAGFHMAS